MWWCGDVAVETRHAWSIPGGWSKTFFGAVENYYFL
jgi:hypothetical protein